MNQENTLKGSVAKFQFATGPFRNMGIVIFISLWHARYFLEMFGWIREKYKAREKNGSLFAASYAKFVIDFF